LLEGYDCDCHIDGGACAKCLIDRNNYRFADKLSKAKAMDWLNKQKYKTLEVPQEVKDVSFNARPVFRELKQIVKDAVSSPEAETIVFCVSDKAKGMSISDWHSHNSEMGKYIHDAIRLGKKVKINVEYHPELHNSNADKLPFVNFSAMPDCEVQFVQESVGIKTVLEIQYNQRRIERYITTDIDALSLSNEWGEPSNHIYLDDQVSSFESEPSPSITESLNEIIRDGKAQKEYFRVKNYFSDIIKPCVVKDGDDVEIRKIIGDKDVKIFFSDMYVNSALSSLLLAYLIKEMRDLYGFEISSLTLQLDSPKRKCTNSQFDEDTRIHYNFQCEEDADAYTYRLIEKLLGIRPEPSEKNAEHHRWLRIEAEDGSFVEIRPDHSIGGGWYSTSTYMNIDTLDGNVIAKRIRRGKAVEVLYYLIMKKSN